MLNVSYKEYILNNDFKIICSTKILDGGEKVYGVVVEQMGLRFEHYLENAQNIKDSREANRLFKEYANRYRQPLGYL